MSKSNVSSSKMNPRLWPQFNFILCFVNIGKSDDSRNNYESPSIPKDCPRSHGKNEAQHNMSCATIYKQNML